jgi:hypothetical protein
MLILHCAPLSALGLPPLCGSLVIAASFRGAWDSVNLPYAWNFCKRSRVNSSALSPLSASRCLRIAAVPGGESLPGTPCAGGTAEAGATSLAASSGGAVPAPRSSFPTWSSLIVLTLNYQQEEEKQASSSSLLLSKRRPSRKRRPTERFSSQRYISPMRRRLNMTEQVRLCYSAANCRRFPPSEPVG